MTDRLADLQLTLAADERFLGHREIHELCRLQQAEIGRLLDELRNERASGGQVCSEQKKVIEELRAELADARCYVAEVAQGVTHYPHGDGEPCVRCELERLRKELVDLQSWVMANTLRGPANLD